MKLNALFAIITAELVGLLVFIALAQTTPHSVALTWTDPSNPTGTTYTVYRAAGLCSGTPTFAKLATGVAALTYTDTPAAIGNWCYQVTATFNAMESAPSPTAAAGVPPFSPPTLQARPN